ncbi:metallopeptidase family protein [Desertibaculum subflavum]|uniref:metallopeptidase family protein n=1 Tax=Desertibaculum subflavum TaxID=2268458 RepID=UPI000E668D19
MSSPPVLAPSLEDIERLARDALATIPEALRRLTQGVVVRVEEFPDEETEREMEIESPFDLLGLYRGVGIEGRDNPRTGTEPDMVFLYRRPLLDYWCETGEDLAHLVRHVMIHEIGHHFGFSDDDMEALEAETE